MHLLCASASVHSFRQSECVFGSHECYDKTASSFYTHTEVFMSQTGEMGNLGTLEALKQVKPNIQYIHTKKPISNHCKKMYDLKGS